MNFNNQLFPSYDAKPISATFAEFFNGKVGCEPFALSGLGEVRQNLLMTEEWMDTTQPKLDYHERSPAEPGIYRDGNGEPTGYGRKLSLPTKVLEQERQFTWKNGQAFHEQKFEAFVSTVSLHRADYYPTAGDIFKWRDVWRQITVVKVAPADYFLNTGFPIYLTIESSLWVPELGLDGILPCGPLGRPSGAAPKRDGIQPISDTPVNDSGPLSVVPVNLISACDCPIKTPQCYIKRCSHYLSQTSQTPTAPCSCP